MNLKISILIFTSLLLFSCKKYGDGYVKGQVLESDTKAPISNTKVFLGKWKKTNHSSSYKYTIIDSVFTDNNGSYTIFFDKDRGYRYSVFARHPNYMSRFIADAYELNYKNTTKDFELDALAYVKFRIKKTNPSLNYFMATLNFQSTNLFVLQNHKNPYDTILPDVYKANGVGANFIDWEIVGVSPIAIRDEKIIPRGDTTILFYQID